MIEKDTRVRAKPGSLAEQGSAGTVDSILDDGLVYVAWDKHASWNLYVIERSADLDVLAPA